mgnify:CR=1 FL=1
MSQFQYILFEISNRVATISLNRPDKRNALNFVVIQELKDALDIAEKSQDVKVILMKGNGKAFCAGADLEYLQALQTYGFNENLYDSTHLAELYYKMYKHPKVIIGQIEGHALAGGCGLATLCDFSFSVPDAKFGYTEVKIGFIPAIVMVFLLKKIGEGKARELLLSGDLISAEKAQQFGLINFLSTPETIAAEVSAFADKLCKENSGGSMEITKRMITDLQNLSLQDALTYAAKMNAHARATYECRRGIGAFLNKEKLDW